MLILLMPIQVCPLHIIDRVDSWADVIPAHVGSMPSELLCRKSRYASPCSLHKRVAGHAMRDIEAQAVQVQQSIDECCCLGGFQLQRLQLQLCNSCSERAQALLTHTMYLFRPLLCSSALLFVLEPTAESEQLSSLHLLPNLILQISCRYATGPLLHMACYDSPPGGLLWLLATVCRINSNTPFKTSTLSCLENRGGRL